MIIASFFLVLVLEYFELLWLLVVPQFLEVNEDLESRWAHDGLRSCDSQVADLVSEAQCSDSQASVLS